MNKKWLFFLIFLFCMYGCCVQHPACDKEALFFEKVGMTDKDDINRTIKVDYVNGQETTLYADEHLSFDVLLTGLTSPVTFDMKETEKFYYFDQKACNWIVFDNQITSLRDEFVVEPFPGLDELVIGGSMIISSESIKTPTTIRIVSKGYLNKEDLGHATPVLGYLDVTILPPK